jgi:hypothetical protein
MQRRRYRLGMADGAHGPGDVPLLTITSCHLVTGPNLPNWQPEAMLASLDEPLQWRGESEVYQPDHILCNARRRRGWRWPGTTWA